ncbi:hypothetical protein KCU62_g101, partial [Aureobasidium sp. EXF-3399]
MVVRPLTTVVSTVAAAFAVPTIPASQVKMLPQNSITLTVSAMVDASAQADDGGSTLNPVWVADADALADPPTVAVGRRLETAVDRTGSTVPVAPTAASADDIAPTSDVTLALAGAAPLESKEAI